MDIQSEHYNIITDFQSIDLLKLESLINYSPYSNPFNTPEFYSFLKSQENAEPFICIASDQEHYLGMTVGAIYREPGIKSFFSRRAIIEGGLVLKTGYEKQATGLLLNSLKSALSKKVIYLEIRNYYDYSDLKPVFQGFGFNYLPYLNFHVDCRDADLLKSRVNKGKWRQINSSLKNGAKIVIPDREDQIKEFYDILIDLYKTRVKKPLPAWSFFRDFQGSGLGTYLLISFEEKIIGGIMCPMDKNAIYEWYVAGLDSRYDKIYPSILATWAAMEYANRNGIPRFDFMGAGQPDQDYGVREFKSRFGGDLVEHGRFRYVFNPLLFKAGQAGLKLLSKL